MVQRKQRMAGVALGVFLLVLAGFTLFSQTLQTALLPKVATAKPVKKTLSHHIEGNGLITPRKLLELNSDSGWKVEKVHVHKEEDVKKGQILVTFDGTELKQQLLDAEDDMKKRALNRELLKEQFIAAQHAGDEREIRMAIRDLDLDRIDADIAKRRMESLRQELERKSTLTAPVDGKVTNLQAEAGMASPPGQPLLTLVETGKGFQFSFTIAKELADLMQIDEKVPVHVNEDTALDIEGTVAEIKDAPSGNGGGMPEDEDDVAKDQKTIVVHVPGDHLKGGESSRISLKKPFQEQGLVIDKNWLKKDATGSYVFVVRENRSSLGNTYTVQKAYVTTGKENGEEIVVLGGLYPEEDIVTESSEPLQEGNRIRLH
ncbi:efflux RND transporter periplasmic adaptor subunit [Paenibacillus daejeonensis]|uniref:efflux RND transporter periplasmic adaptor subunit n=1 Tax=Paenibacillus daejeonensis TaxID=135193 RepID=UPI00035F89AF|nr:efflux RND transporter periplasmic adaptor subunit [Paenibacillus daejeonensis]